MPKQKKASSVDLTVVVDRSGSMASMKEEAEGGLNAFFEKQKAAAPDTLLTLVQFDTEYEFVYEAVPIGKAGKYELVPRGCTALLDAVGKAAARAAERIGKGVKSIFAVITDGQENSSHEWQKSGVKEAIDRLKSKGCEVVFLGANIDSFAEAGALGVSASLTSNYAPTRRGMAVALDCLASNAVNYSRGVSASMCFSESQKRSMADNITPEDLSRIKAQTGSSWSQLERAAGLGTGTLSKYAKGDTASLSETTQDRLRNAFGL